MKTIIETPGEPYMIEDRTTPVIESTQYKGQIFLSLHDAGLALGETTDDVFLSAESKQATKKGNLFSWPSRKALTTHLHDYRVIRNQGHPPVPVTVVFHVAGPKGGTKGGKRESKHYRTLTAFRQANGLTVAQAEKILSRHPGWQKHLKPRMVSATQHSPGWTPPGGWSTQTGRMTQGPSFRLWYSKKLYHWKEIGVTTSSDIGGVPDYVLENC